MKSPRSSLRRLAGVLDYLVDDRVGIVSYVKELPKEAGAPDFFHFYAKACNTQAFGRQPNFSAAGGASADRGSAIAKAVGEAVERYCAALYEVEELPLSSFESAPFPCVPPSEFALYSWGQYEQPGFPWVPFDPTTPVRWTAALDPLDDETVHIPAAMVFVPYFFYQGSGEAPIVQPISTGLACHCSPSEAALSAACETIERDAFMITWQARLARPQVRIETLSDANYDLVERFERTGAVVTLLDITMDTAVPTILAVLRHASPTAPALVFAAASAMTSEEAVRKSLEELAHTRRYSQRIKSHLPRLAPDPSYSNVVDQISHLNFWGDHSNALLAEFIFSSEERVDFDQIANLATGDPERDLQILCDRLRAMGHRLLLADLTTPDVRDLGLTIVRAIIPGYHPLFMGYGIRALGGSRLWEVPQKLGHQGISRELGDNPAPHPYP
ncbi:MAG TPA: YcaO-like family protein [Candidatus Tectomicrobia bacterium]|nr:YcaO-like family protein [Candidatus Tectomicrobia bacterium]